MPALGKRQITNMETELKRFAMNKFSEQSDDGDITFDREGLNKFVENLCELVISSTAPKARQRREPRNDDPNRVKKPLPASLAWGQAKRVEIIQEHFNGESCGHAWKKKASELWKKLSDDERMPWLTKYAEAKALYDESRPESATPRTPRTPWEFDTDQSVDDITVPEDWTGPHKASFCRQMAAGRQRGAGVFETFAQAVKAAEELGSLCGGITRTTRGFELRYSGSPEEHPEGSKEGYQVSWAKKDFVPAARTKKPRKKKSESDSDSDGQQSPAVAASEPVKKAKKAEKPVVQENSFDADTDEGEPAGGDDSDDSDDSDDEDVSVTPWEHKGHTYLVDESTNEVYDIHSQEEIGKRTKKDNGKWKLIKSGK